MGQVSLTTTLGLFLYISNQDISVWILHILSVLSIIVIIVGNETGSFSSTMPLKRTSYTSSQPAITAFILHFTNNGQFITWRKKCSGRRVLWILVIVHFHIDIGRKSQMFFVLDLCAYICIVCVNIYIEFQIFHDEVDLLLAHEQYQVLESSELC